MAALNALFEPHPTFAREPEPETEPPANLDEVVSADAAMPWDGPVHRWYRGLDDKGILRVFRFQRGKGLDDWKALLKSQRLASVNGPFRTQQHALAG